MFYRNKSHYYGCHDDYPRERGGDVELAFGELTRGKLLGTSSFYVLAHVHIQVLIQQLLKWFESRPAFAAKNTRYILYSLGEVYR